MLEKKGLSDTRIAQITGISLRTITQWKTQKDTYRYKLYRLLKTMDESELIKAFSQFCFFVFACFFLPCHPFLRGLFCLFFCQHCLFVLCYFWHFLPHTSAILLLHRTHTRHTLAFRAIFATHAPPEQTALIHLTHLMHARARTSPRICPRTNSAPHFSAKCFCAFFIPF